jgi:hypothetical protein
MIISFLDPGDFDPISLELANGHKIKIKAGLFAEEIELSEIRPGVQAPRFYGIRVYCLQDSRLKKIDELRDGRECTRASVPHVLETVKEHISSREYLEHEDSEGFCDWLREVAEENWGTPEDATEHLDRLPSIHDPYSYDREKDFRNEEG